jgi:hypothetical protein
MTESFDLPEPGLPTPEPEGQPAPAPAPEPEPEYVEIKNRDFERQVTKGRFQEIADELGMDVDRLRQTVQIGLDGTRLYEQINDERDKLREAWGEIARMQQEATQRTTSPPPPTPQHRPVSRPPAEDIYGNVAWLAEHFERISPALEQLPELRGLIEDTRRRVEQADNQREVAEERSVAFKAYSDVADNWKKQGWGELPQRQRMESYLKDFPISDDLNLSWHDIWERVGWMIEGPNIARRQRRQAVLDSQKPGARIVTPGSTSPHGTPMPSPATANGDDNAALEEEAARLTAQLQGQNLAGVYGDRRPLR